MPNTQEPIKTVALSITLIWAGFVLPSLVTTSRLRGGQLNQVVPDALFWLVSFAVQSGILLASDLRLPEAV